ncbi:hypothetical protein ITX31_09650 [Arthrobacter gandavensis]|uniref:hypothetical protein n=1 Tax=Arthrobacter gandavensis TaxID=169960 RepID=UPI0018903B23|nr:hypothetical protein [Arthrobacter gandavensis]MBF4994374.1 hypothetical protein [Arthrobacter gandavensis]
MRLKNLAAVGAAALLLGGCSQAAPTEQLPPVQDRLPVHPAPETGLGAIEGFSSSGVTSTFVSEGQTVAAYLACGSEGASQTEGELRLRVTGQEARTVPCGTTENPTRTLFDNFPRGSEFDVTVESVDEPLSFALVLTDATR